MKGEKRTGPPERPLRSVCFGSPRAREESGSRGQWAQPEQERGTGVRDSVSCRVPSLQGDHSSLQESGERGQRVEGEGQPSLDRPRERGRSWLRAGRDSRTHQE